MSEGQSHPLAAYEPGAARAPHERQSRRSRTSALDGLAGEVLTEALSPDNETLLHPQDRRALQREQCRRAKEARHGCKVRHL